MTAAPTELDFAGLLKLLGFADDEFVALFCEHEDGTICTAVRSPTDAPAWVAKMPGTSAIFFGVNPVKGPARTNDGRGEETDVTRLAALVPDIDVKDGACPNLDIAKTIVAEIGLALGPSTSDGVTQPAAVTSSGGGLHPYWVTDGGQIPDGGIGRALAVVRRFGRLVEKIADKHGVHVDNVFELNRMFRVPGTCNRKGAAPGETGVLATTVLGPGGQLPLAQVDERLTKAGIDERDGDATPTATAVISPPADWIFADRTCPYVAKMIAAWPTDRPEPGGGRNYFVYDRYIRLFAAHRLGCVSEADYEWARQALPDLLAELVSTIEPRRKVRPQEIAGFYKYGIPLVAAKSDDETGAELGPHGHDYDVGSASPQPAAPPQPAAAALPIPLKQAHKVFCKWLGKDYDTDALDLCLAAAAVEKLDGDPLWILIVSGSGNAKTETVQPFHIVGGIVVGSISSEAALLSATQKRDRAKTATGGLLRKLGDRGLLVIKDVTSVLSMDRIARGRVLSALREVYDGHWVRDVGAEGGRTIDWVGRITVIGAVTTAWDTHHAVIAQMGDRFALLRMNSRHKDPRRAAGRRSISNTGDEAAMREELAAAVGGVIAGMTTTAIRLTEKESDIIVDAADLTTLARTGVEYDYKGGVIDAHDPEMPTRFAKQLAQVVRGAVAIGMDRTDALTLAIRCARDSMPPLRLAIIDDLSAHPHSSTQEVRQRLDKPRMTVDRQLQALHMLGVLTCDEVPYGAGDKVRWYYTLAADIDPEALDPSKVAQKSK